MSSKVNRSKQGLRKQRISEFRDRLCVFCGATRSETPFHLDPEKVIFHTFPSDPGIQRCLWLDKVCLSKKFQNRYLGKKSRKSFQPAICGRHFKTGKTTKNWKHPDYQPNQNIEFTLGESDTESSASDTDEGEREEGEKTEENGPDSTENSGSDEKDSQEMANETDDKNKTGEMKNAPATGIQDSSRSSRKQKAEPEFRAVRKPGFSISRNKEQHLEEKLICCYPMCRNRKFTEVSDFIKHTNGLHHINSGFANSSTPRRCENCRDLLLPFQHNVIQDELPIEEEAVPEKPPSRLRNEDETRKEEQQMKKKQEDFEHKANLQLSILTKAKVPFELSLTCPNRHLRVEQWKTDVCGLCGVAWLFHYLEVPQQTNTAETTDDLSVSSNKFKNPIRKSGGATVVPKTKITAEQHLKNVVKEEPGELKSSLKKDKVVEQKGHWTNLGNVPEVVKQKEQQANNHGKKSKKPNVVVAEELLAKCGMAPVLRIARTSASQSATAFVTEKHNAVFEHLFQTVEAPEVPSSSNSESANDSVAWSDFDQIDFPEANATDPLPAFQLSTQPRVGDPGQMFARRYKPSAAVARSDSSSHAGARRRKQTWSSEAKKVWPKNVSQSEELELVEMDATDPSLPGFRLSTQPRVGDPRQTFTFARRHNPSAAVARSDSSSHAGAGRRKQTWSSEAKKVWPKNISQSEELELIEMNPTDPSFDRRYKPSAAVARSDSSSHAGARRRKQTWSPEAKKVWPKSISHSEELEPAEMIPTDPSLNCPNRLLSKNERKDNFCGKCGVSWATHAMLIQPPHLPPRLVKRKKITPSPAPNPNFIKCSFKSCHFVCDQPKLMRQHIDIRHKVLEAPLRRRKVSKFDDPGPSYPKSKCKKSRAKIRRLQPIETFDWSELVKKESSSDDDTAHWQKHEPDTTLQYEHHNMESVSGSQIKEEIP